MQPGSVRPERDQVGKRPLVVVPIGAWHFLGFSLNTLPTGRVSACELQQDQRLQVGDRFVERAGAE